jgi:hypothetical protein
MTTMTQCEQGQSAAAIRGLSASIQPRLVELVHADLFPPEGEVSERLHADRTFAALYGDENAVAEHRTNSIGERVTCPVHRTWLYLCINSLPHDASRWCATCGHPMQIAVDELSCNVSVTCSCFDGDAPTSLAQVLRAACHRSVKAAMFHRHGVNAGHPAAR